MYFELQEASFSIKKIENSNRSRRTIRVYFDLYVWYLPEDEFVDYAARNNGHTNYALLAWVSLS